jgi:hypothetical protein
MDRVIPGVHIVPSILFEEEKSDFSAFSDQFEAAEEDPAAPILSETPIEEIVQAEWGLEQEALDLDPQAIHGFLDEDQATLSLSRVVFKMFHRLMARESHQDSDLYISQSILFTMFPPFIIHFDN